MPLPPFDRTGEMPPGVYRAAIDEVEARFGGGMEERHRAAATLRDIYDRAAATGHLRRFIVYGSFVSGKARPNDVDVFLVMSREFDMEKHGRGVEDIFSHSEADRILGASVFWVTERLPAAMTENFVQGWQKKRDGSLRGIVEIIG